MVKCSFSVPLRLWSFNISTYDVMTMENVFNNKGYFFDEFTSFKSELSSKLGDLPHGLTRCITSWYLKVPKHGKEVIIELYTNYDEISLAKFSDTVKCLVLPILNNLHFRDQILYFNDVNFNISKSARIVYTDKQNKLQ